MQTHSVVPSGDFEEHLAEVKPLPSTLEVGSFLENLKDPQCQVLKRALKGDEVRAEKLDQDWTPQLN